MSDSQDVFQAATDRAELIEKLLEIGTALSKTDDLGEVLSLILTKCREITCSDAGSVYLIDHSADFPSLLFKVAQNFSSPTTTFREFAIPMTQKSLAGYVALTGNTLNLPDAYETPADAPYQLDRSFDQSICYRTRSVLVLPMQNQQGDTIGVLQLINRKTSADAVVTPENALTVTQPYSKWEERVLKSLASQAAISLERNQLHQSIENLFEGFVKASVQVIEARDPCTSGHSERVAELTVRLSEEVSAVSSGLLAPIAFDRNQIKEVRYAALLHDFGKVGVPEAILVKAKKLYPLQLEVVEHRFALAQQAVELECAQAKYRHLIEHPSHLSHLIQHSDPSDYDCLHCQELEQLNAQSANAIAQLKHYWNIILEANEPSILTEKPLLQLKELAQVTYQDLDGLEKPLVTPEEMEQLLVRRGNLTELERQAIQAHVTHTYEFLKRIPWTKELQGVPLIAYGHHEKLDGSGYPRGLNEVEIPVQSQIMAIADIYDALTAGDRPYKRSLDIPSAIQILKQEAEHNKLNTELILLFEHRQVFSVLGHQLSP